MDITDVSLKYDAIIFSSVLHEISSYYPVESKRFTSIPIFECLKKTNSLLCDNGNIILRDGLLVDKVNLNRKVLISFKNTNDSYWLYRFQNEFRGFDKLKEVDSSIRVIDNNVFEVGLAFLKEFLYTFTWGSESYNREVKERFGILDKNTWVELLEKSGFDIEEIVESKEKYEEYLAQKVTITNTDSSSFTYPMITILIKAKKIKNI